MHSPFDGNYIQLVRTMEAARHQLDAMPDDTEWSQDGLATLDDVRHVALRLADTAEATIEAFQGTKSTKKR